MVHFIQYYSDQIGGGRSGGIDNVFYGGRHQKGYGIGAFLDELLRMALPFIKIWAKAFGKEAFRAVVNIKDYVMKRGLDIKHSLMNVQENLEKISLGKPQIN